MRTPSGKESLIQGPSPEHAPPTRLACPFDLLICDIGLPDGSGLDVVSALRKRNAVDKAIAMTGYGMAEAIERCKEVGFDTHLTKPVDIEDLERLISML